jgi:hypothetical protein
MGFAIDVVSPEYKVYNWMMQCAAGDEDGENDGLCYGWRVGFIPGDLRHAELDPKFRVKVGGGSSIDPAALIAEFNATGGSIPAISEQGGQSDYNVSSNGCFTLSAWFLRKTNLSNINVVGKNAWGIVQIITGNNPGTVTLSNTPKAPGIFASKYAKVWNAGSTCGDSSNVPGGVCGHTGIVTSVKDNGDGSYTAHTLETWSGASPLVQEFDHTVKPSDNKVDFVYLGDVLK